MDIHSCCQLYKAMRNTWDNQELASAFQTEFEEAREGLILCDKQLSYFRYVSMYMNGRWEYDHKYFQRMIEREQKMNSETVGGIITNLQETIEKKNSSSSEDESMPGLQERARKNSSSDEDTNFFGEDGIYDNGEPWGSKELSLKQIIGGKSGGMFHSNIPTLYAFSWYGYAQVSKNPVDVVKNKLDFHQAKE